MEHLRPGGGERAVTLLGCGGFEKGAVGAAGAAAVVAIESVGDAVGDALDHDVGDFFVEAEGLGDVEFDAGMFGGGLGGEVGDVGGGVAAGGEEVGVDDDEGGALGDALVERLCDGGFGEFHVGGFDDGGAGDAFEHGGDVEEHVIGGGFFGAVVDDDETDGFGGVGEHVAWAPGE